MKRLFFGVVFLAILSVQLIMAQSFVVKGKVVSKTDGMPLIGASVLQKGTTNGVVTDIDGNYQLQIQGKDAMLRFSYIGMQPQEFKVNAQTNVLDVTLVDNTEMVDEVVVVAYGVRKIRKIRKCTGCRFRPGTARANPGTYGCIRFG